MDCTFTYDHSVPLGTIKNLLLAYLRTAHELDDSASFQDHIAGPVVLENVVQDLQQSIPESTSLLRLRFGSSGLVGMARMLNMYPSGESIPDYRPEKAFANPGHTNVIVVDIEYTSNSQQLYVCCHPDYRGGAPLSLDDALEIGVQCLKIGYDFICKPLASHIGQPVQYTITGKGIVPAQLIPSLLSTEISLSEKVDLLK